MAVEARPAARAILTTGFLVVIGYYALWAGEYSTLDLLRLTEQQRVEQAALSVAEAEVDSLRTLVEALESDPATIEMVAREHFGMIREGETLYRFVEAPVDATPLDIAASTAVP